MGQPFSESSIYFHIPDKSIILDPIYAHIGLTATVITENTDLTRTLQLWITCFSRCGKEHLKTNFQHEMFRDCESHVHVEVAYDLEMKRDVDSTATISRCMFCQ